MQSKSQQIQIQTIYISDIEQRRNQISSENLKISLCEFHKNGLVILENAVGLPALNHIRERMLQDIPKNLASPRVHYNHGKDHMNVTQTPPLLREYLHEEVWANRFAIAIIEHIIGPRPQLSYATSNIALPGGQGRQAVHSDYYCSHYDFPVFLEACIFLDDVSSRNGSTEVWLGTHHGYNKEDHTFTDMGWIKREVFTERAGICPPFQPSIPKGSICIRDLRLWHAGMPNSTTVPRIMLGFLYSSKWFGSQMRLKLSIESRKRVETWKHIDLLSVAELDEDKQNYLDFRQVLILSQEKSDLEAQHMPKHGSVIAGPEHYWCEAIE
jgi:ectoine hydroxylase-related dioxygenase (phytanoyl-CoA dioxygenase family)